MMDVTDTELYRQHIVHYFDTQLGHDIITLSEKDKFRLFQMLTDYADILETIFHPGIPILEHILEKPGYAAAAHPHEGINHDHECEIICQYDQWKASVQTA